MVVTANLTSQNEAVGIYRVGRNDEASTSRVYFLHFQEQLKDVYITSEFWRSKLRFNALRQRLDHTEFLSEGWSTYQSEPPNSLARSLAEKVLRSLEEKSLPPSALTPSSEGGVSITFVNGARRALFETYNTGEIVAATYSTGSEPVVWELQKDESQIQSAIDQIRVHLAA